MFFVLCVYVCVCVCIGTLVFRCVALFNDILSVSHMSARPMEPALWCDCHQPTLEKHSAC